MQVHTARLTAALDELGLDQTVITAYRPGAPRVQRIGHRAVVHRAGVPLRHVRQLYGVASIPLVIRGPAPDVVHVHLGEDIAILPLARWAARRAKAPLVATVHCSLRHTVVPHGIRSAMLRAIGGPLQLELLRAADAVLVLSERAAEFLVDDGVDPMRLRVVALGVDLEPGGGERRPAATDRRPTVVFAGRLVPEKGVHELIEALGSLPEVGLLVVGDGPERRSLEAAAAAMGMADRIRFVGAVAHADVHAYLRDADVVVAPSWFEERGRVLLEAMAAGTPVIAARSGGPVETVKDGVNGLLVPPRAPKALAAAIARVLSDDRLAAALAAAGRRTAATQPLSSLVADTLDVYRTVLGAPAVGEVVRPSET
jgi:glycosyltransferase involved in cell wall biosynthesis